VKTRQVHARRVLLFLNQVAVEPQRSILFCLASGTDWERAGVTHATAQQMLVRGLIDRDPGPARFKLTPLGRDVLAALLKPPVDEQNG
jgi:hypothetical protein